MLIPITALFAVISAAVMLMLAIRVTLFRRQFKAGMGDKGDRDFQAAIRAHANNTEYTPIALILMAVAELNGANHWALLVIGSLFVASRILHAQGMIVSHGGAAFGRLWGTVGTWASLIALMVLVTLNLQAIAL